MTTEQAPSELTDAQILAIRKRHPAAIILDGEALNFASDLIAADRALVASQAQPVELTSAARDVLAERRRQVEAEGRTAEHDDEHNRGELAQVAAELLLDGTGFCIDDPQGLRTKWGLVTKHRDDRRRQLVIASALGLAEIERLDREAARPKWSTCKACTSPTYCRDSLRGCDIDEIAR